MTPPERRFSFEPVEMQRLLDGEQASVRQRVREILARPSFRFLSVTASIEEQREQAFRWCQELADEGVGMLAVPQRYGGEEDFAAFMAAFETIAFHDLSLTIKFTVQFGIWLGSVLLLGNERQHAEFLRKIGTFELPGCFAMTEIGHGSNVRELETKAVYDAEREEFVVTSPTWTAGKNYIGNGACHGRLATVFAQLEVGGDRHGVHALLVPLRGENGAVLPGVRIEDNGPKMGENGVDNARIWFDEVRVGRGALLDRFGGVGEDGSYRSSIASAGARFFTTISALVGGRISIAAAGLSAAKSGLAIAVKYAMKRRQFRAPGAAAETPLMGYQTHQRRLLPLVANAYALDFLLKDLVRRRAETMDGHDPAGSRELELLAAGVKAWGTWNTTRTLQTCRECCGGEGYMSVNRLPALKADSDIFTTFEGDNTVLMVWVGRQLLARRLQAEKEAAASGSVGETDARLTVEFGRLPEVRYETLFARRAEEMIRQAGEAVQWRIGRGTPEHEAVAQSQSALLRAATAHIESVLLARFDAVVETHSEAGGLRDVLGRLRALFAAAVFEEHRGWYLERDWIVASWCQSLPQEVDAQCALLAPDAEALVEAFGIPGQCLGALVEG